MAFGLAVFLVTGAVAGWLAGVLVKGRGFGLIGSIVVGVLGSIIGGALFDYLGIQPGGFFGYVAAATVGAAGLLFLVALIKKP
jgi:uncharacterized membrane protein YeaQ/YmgE (transglycosylase-associated protein family)